LILALAVSSTGSAMCEAVCSLMADVQPVNCDGHEPSRVATAAALVVSVVGDHDDCGRGVDTPAILRAPRPLQLDSLVSHERLADVFSPAVSADARPVLAAASPPAPSPPPLLSLRI
jgi:hypothetical protein